PGQINAQVPFEVPLGAVTVTVNSGGAAVGSASVLVESAAPGLFMLAPGHAAAFNQDGSVNGPSQPAPVGSVIAVYLTGLGAVTNFVASGAAAPAIPLSLVSATVTASIAGQPAQVMFAGLAPGFAGLYQVNLVVPPVSPGDEPLRVSVPGDSSNTATISVQ
ncbi:MAG: hypothetical protein ACREH9_01240, partial [Pseudomonadota bacterium]